MLDTTTVYLGYRRKFFLVTSIERTCVTYSTHNSITLKCTHSYIWMRGEQLTSISIFKWITALCINKEWSREKKQTKQYHLKPKNIKTCQQVASLTMLSLQKVWHHHFKKRKKPKHNNKKLKAGTAQTINNTTLWHSPSDSNLNFINLMNF